MSDIRPRLAHLTPTVMIFTAFALTLVLGSNSSSATVILTPGETKITIEPIILEYLRAKDTGGYLNVEWNATYWSGREADIGAKCYLNCEHPEAGGYDIDSNCAGKKYCMFEGAAGVGGCAIASPNYIYQNTQSNNVTCKFYDPLVPSVIYLPFPAVQFKPIDFDVSVTPAATVTVGKSVALIVSIKNNGIIASSYEVNASTISNLAIIENGLIPETEIIEWNESTAAYPKITMLSSAETVTLFVKTKSKADPVVCSSNADCAYIGVCGLEPPACSPGGKCTKVCAVQISANNRSVPEFGVLGLVQVMLLAAFVVLFARKKLLSLDSD